jgi:sucrose-6F-phosphate phosphohydrolase
MNAVPWLLVCDLDGTLLGHDESLFEFEKWSRNLDTVRIAYATGRHLVSVIECLTQTALPLPDFLITNIGTEIWSMPTATPLFPWPILNHCSWNRDRVVRYMEKHTDIELQPEAFQTAFKVSYFAEKLSQARLRHIAKELADAALDFEIVYSGGKFLDFLPPDSHKGAAVDALGKHLGLSRDRIIVAGDSGNDISMFQLGFRGIIVSNAQTELKAIEFSKCYQSRTSYAAGVLEGLAYWGVT